MLKIGLVGVGYLGSRHLRHLTEIPDIDVTAIWDIDKTAKNNASANFNVPAASDLDDLLSRCEAVVVVSPTNTHFSIGMQVIKHGLPLFIEKPICASLEQGKELVEEAETRQIPIQVGHIERFNRAYRSLRNLNVNPRFIEGHRLAEWNPRGVDVAVILDLMIHDIDLVLALAGSKPNHIHASGVGVITPTIDIATARLEFPNGLVANLTASRISLKKMRKLRLFGDSEYIALDLGKGTCEYVGVDDGASKLPEQAIPLGEMVLGDKHRRVFQRFMDDGEGDAMRLELESFKESVTRQSTPIVSGRDGLNALAVAEDIVKEINEHLSKEFTTH